MNDFAINQNGRNQRSPARVLPDAVAMPEVARAKPVSGGEADGGEADREAKRLQMAESHLVLYRKTLTRQIRWSPRFPDWGVFRVAEGAMLLHRAGTSLLLAAGEVVVSPPGATRFHLEGKSTAVEIDYFLVSPEFLTGVLTWPERLHLRGPAAGTPETLRRWSPSSPIALEMSRIRLSHPSGNGALLRCELLRLFASLFADELTSRGECPPAWMPAAERVGRLLRQVPSAALMEHSSAELARRCGCSRRHFNRLFKESCGMSVRRYQIELRLTKAGQLLRESGAKVIHVAMESGFHHLGLFNTMFKRRYGMTPVEWRRK